MLGLATRRPPSRSFVEVVAGNYAGPWHGLSQCITDGLEKVILCSLRRWQVIIGYAARMLLFGGVFNWPIFPTIRNLLTQPIIVTCTRR